MTFLHSQSEKRKIFMANKLRQYNLAYFIKRGFNSFVRNWIMSAASILILLSCMLVLGSVWLVIDGINNNFTALDDLYVVDAYAEDGVSAAELESIKAQISSLDNVKEVTLVTKAQVLQDYKDRAPTLADILDRYTEETNPYPDTFKITFDEYEGVSELIYSVKSIKGIEKVKSSVDVYKNVETLKSALTVIGIGVMALLLLVAVIVIMNTVKLTVFTRRQQIIVMRYIGATQLFVAAPFIIEGIIIGVISAVIAFVTQFLLYDKIMLDLLAKYKVPVITPFSEYAPFVALAFLAVGIFAGVFASSVSVKRHLDV